MRKRIFILVTVMALLGAGGCKGEDPVQPVPEEEQIQTEGDGVAESQSEEVQSDELPEAVVSKRAAWCVYWDGNSAQAAAEMISEYDELVLFGCIYEENHTLHIPEALEQLYNEFPGKDQGTQIYLSFINDVMQEDGTSRQKSPEFLELVL